jgi:hypothetical protein
MDALTDISMVIYIMLSIFLVIILVIAIKKYLNSRNTPGERTAFLFLLLSISGIVFLFVFLFSLFLTIGTPSYNLQQRFYYIVLVTIPFLFVLFAVQTQFGDLLEKGRYFTIAGIITYGLCLIIAGVFDVNTLWAYILYYVVAAACVTPSIYLWINLINVARKDSAMDPLKFSYYLLGFSLLDAFYLHDFFMGVIYRDARITLQALTDIIDAILMLGVVFFIVMAQLRASSSSK